MSLKKNQYRINKRKYLAKYGAPKDTEELPYSVE
jgi:hypothetical protein